MYDVSKKILPCIFKVGEKTRHKFYRHFCLLLHFLWLFASLFWVHKRNRYKERNITSQRTHVPSSAFFYYPFTVFVILYTFQDFNNRWIILASSSGICPTVSWFSFSLTDILKTFCYRTLLQEIFSNSLVYLGLWWP